LVAPNDEHGLTTKRGFVGGSGLTPATKSRLILSRLFVGSFSTAFLVGRVLLRFGLGDSHGARQFNAIFDRQHFSHGADSDFSGCFAANI
jgi:hypothetical protein